MKQLSIIFLFSLLALTSLNADSFSYAQKDYQSYAKTRFASASWNSFVQQGFEALDQQNARLTVDLLRKAIQMGCQSPLVYFKLALSYEALGAYYSSVQYYELARDQFKKANRNHRYSKQFNENYGRALYMMGQKDKALKILKKSGKRTTSALVLKLLAQIAIENGQTLEATAYYERYFKFGQPRPSAAERLDANLTLARLYRQQDSQSGATRYYKEVLEIDPNHPEAKKYVGRNSRFESRQESVERVMEIFGNH